MGAGPPLRTLRLHRRVAVDAWPTGSPRDVDPDAAGAVPIRPAAQVR